MLGGSPKIDQKLARYPVYVFLVSLLAKRITVVNIRYLLEHLRDLLGKLQVSS